MTTKLGTDGDAIDRLRGMFAKVCTDFEALLVEKDGESDHVHLLAASCGGAPIGIVRQYIEQ